MIYSYLLLFYTASVTGWIWEVMVYWISHQFQYSLGELFFSYRGVLHGPWAPIYGVGFVLLIILYHLSKKKTASFVLESIAGCGVIEYLTAVILEYAFQAKWWDYSNAFLNVNGKICFISVVGFGVGGAMLVLLLYPAYLKFCSRISLNRQKVTSLILSLLFAADVIYSFFMPNMGLGVSPV